MTTTYRIGADENGLGARLGPLVVTAVLARVDERGARTLRRKLPERLAQDLGDSKQLMSHADYSLGEAWARALAPNAPASPSELFAQLSHEPLAELQKPCAGLALDQCWRARSESFLASEDTVARIQKHRARLAERGIELLRVQSRVVCTKALNEAKARGQNRFIADLHAMERLVLGLRASVDSDVFATCGKVGGIGQYGRFFGPLSGMLHVELEQSRARSAYRFPGLGELHFVRDADAADVLVMLASLVGKYVRELLMHRIASFYPSDDEPSAPSGYHDPVTARFVARTSLFRRERGIPTTCFERAREAES